MLKTMIAGASAFALLLASPAAAQTPAPAPAPAPAVQAVDVDPALWVLKDADTTIYLFGTVHVLKPGLGWFDDEIKAAFDKSDELVLELIQPEPAEAQKLVLELAIDRDGPPLSEKLPADKRPALAAALTANGIPAAQFEPFEPWFVALTLSLAPLPRLGYDVNSGVEPTLAAAAKAANKPIVPLETAAGQLGVLDGLPEPVQIAYLERTVEDLPKIGDELSRLIAAWGKGDAETLASIMNEGLDQPALRDALLTRRNIAWADWIKTRLDKPGTVFIAVGAGHLAGSDSVQAQLAKHKLVATRVKY